MNTQEQLQVNALQQEVWTLRIQVSQMVLEDLRRQQASLEVQLDDEQKKAEVPIQQ